MTQQDSIIAVELTAAGAATLDSFAALTSGHHLRASAVTSVEQFRSSGLGVSVVLEKDSNGQLLQPNCTYRIVAWVRTALGRTAVSQPLLATTTAAGIPRWGGRDSQRMCNTYGRERISEEIEVHLVASRADMVDDGAGEDSGSDHHDQQQPPQDMQSLTLDIIGPRYDGGSPSVEYEVREWAEWVRRPDGSWAMAATGAPPGDGDCPLPSPSRPSCELDQQIQAMQVEIKKANDNGEFEKLSALATQINVLHQLRHPTALLPGPGREQVRWRGEGQVEGLLAGHLCRHRCGRRCQRRCVQKRCLLSVPRGVGLLLKVRARNAVGWSNWSEPFSWFDQDPNAAAPLPLLQLPHAVLLEVLELLPLSTLAKAQRCCRFLRDLPSANPGAPSNGVVARAVDAIACKRLAQRLSALPSGGDIADNIGLYSGITPTTPWGYSRMYAAYGATVDDRFPILPTVGAAITFGMHGHRGDARSPCYTPSCWASIEYDGYQVAIQSIPQSDVDVDRAVAAMYERCLRYFKYQGWRYRKDDGQISDSTDEDDYAFGHEARWGGSDLIHWTDVSDARAAQIRLFRFSSCFPRVTKFVTRKSPMQWLTMRCRADGGTSAVAYRGKQKQKVVWQTPADSAYTLDEALIGFERMLAR